MSQKQKFHIYHRRSIRLKNYDYSQSGLYFITICTQNRIELFGEIKNGKMILNAYGEIVEKHWQKIPKYYPDVRLLEYVIMPNHIHGILWFTKYIGDPNPVGAIHELPLHESPLHELPLRNNQKTQFKYRNHCRNMALSKIIGRFKMQSAKQINILRNMAGHPVWQRNYYEHIIRNEKSYSKIAEYIVNNPLKWRDDKYYVPNP